MNLRVFILIIVFTAVVAAPAALYGQGGLVPCNGPDCDFRKLLELANNIINFIILVSIPLAAIAFAYAGYLFLTAAGDEGKISKGKEVFSSVLTGFLFILAAWLIVKAIVTALIRPEFYESVLDFI